MEFMRLHTKFHNEKIKTHRCLVCQKTFPYDERFINHLRNHKKNQHKICFCPECGRKFSKPRLMEDHIRFIHNKESLFCCPECGQGELMVGLLEEA
jgi:predicted  nucleic acid-binding Zn-ribbon protein